ncbi:MAG: Nitrogen regulation protein NR(II) [Alphaproteobacteria bacterium MarineAlpha11_Bin1]|nr:MAG: Nitrogen regulation protein NR(II) [Alphaproteobacteria bacterium MarineAlpha11_Bin1]|tara:strand:+ start:999 stop:2126 length:1128 start_codon:yes stop_codon:yes gene_type:complete
MSSLIESGGFSLRPLDSDMILGALPFAVLAVDSAMRIRFLNIAAEQFFGHGANGLTGLNLEEIMPPHSPLLSLVSQALQGQKSISEYDVSLSFFEGGTRNLAITAAPLGDGYDLTVISLHEQSIARQINSQITHRNAARSVNGLAAVLAHEVKNPLSGIRGAAQLLERSVSSDEDLGLTRLICEETDRICDLVDSMGLFSDATIDRTAVNIHQILERVRQVAEAGFGRHVYFVEEYDPSLPPVHGNADQLIQALLNVVKNACEAVTENEGKIILRTAYQHSVRLALPGGGTQIQLPLLVAVIDNGRGISPDVAENLFDPFVTSKSDGSGLGMALAAKVVGDHGGIIEFDTADTGTEFRLRLPMCQDGGSGMEEKS